MTGFLPHVTRLTLTGVDYAILIIYFLSCSHRLV